MAWLVSEELEALFNKAHHNLSHDKLLDTIMRLVSSNLIFVKNKQKDSNLTARKPIKAAFEERRFEEGTYYGLTSKGGAWWEKFASPNWSNFIDHTSYYPDNSEIEQVEILCADKKHLKAYFQSLCFHEIEVEEETIRWDTISPWQATYWKELPNGHRVRFKGKEKSQQVYSPKEPSDSWWDKMWYEWG